MAVLAVLAIMPVHAANDGGPSQVKEPQQACTVTASQSTNAGPASDAASWTIREWAPLGSALAGLLGLFGALIAVRVGQRNNQATIAAAQRNSEATVIQKSNEGELTAITKLLDGFYGPFLQISETNALIYGELRAKQSNSVDFKLLTALLNEDWRKSLSPTDKTLVEEIVRNDASLEVLIRERAGLVESKVLPYLARASAHFRMIQLAHAGSLGHEPDRIARYRYPWQLDTILASEIARLQHRCELIRLNPATALGPMRSLDIESKLALETWPKREPLN